MHLWCRRAFFRFIVDALESVMENAMTLIAVTSWYQACEAYEPKCPHSFWRLSQLRLAPNCFLNLFWSNWSFHLDPYSIFWYPSPCPVLFWKAQPGRASNPLLNLPTRYILPEQTYLWETAAKKRQSWCCCCLMKIIIWLTDQEVLCLWTCVNM